MAGTVIKVEDVMTKGFIAIKAGDTVQDAIDLMRDRQVSSLLVEMEGGGSKHWENFGIVTRKDILNELIAKGKDPVCSKVESIMSYPLVVVSSCASMGQAVVLMAEIDKRRLPVIDEEGYMVGLVSNSDIIKAI